MEQIRREFFDRYIELHPEEATTLGISAGAECWRDHRPEALQDEERWLAQTKRELDACNVSALSEDERLDHLCMRRLVDVHLHQHAWLYATVDWSMFPYTMLEVQRLHAQTDAERAQMAARARALPGFLAQLRANIERAMADGTYLPDTSFVEFLAEAQLPAAIASLRGYGLEDAADAYAAHRVFLQEIPSAHAKPIGEAELRTRMSIMLGIEEPPEDLIRRAREDLTQIQASLLEVAAEVASPQRARTLADVQELAAEMQRELLASDPLAFYGDLVARATAFVRERGLFDLPDDYAMGIEELPQGLAVACGAGNWPAPLLRKDKLGHFLVARDPALNPVAWAADLTVHEGIPGHHLQSFVWQRRFHAERAPVRFLVVHDHIAMPRHYWAPMLNIEGWAVYAEELMRREGFFSKKEEMFVLMAHAVRAARVIGDLSLAAGAMSSDEIASMLTQEACLTPRQASLEARRYAQIPLQASTYHLGRKAIEAVAGAAPDLAELHRRFLAQGPVEPGAVPSTLLA